MPSLTSTRVRMTDRARTRAALGARLLRDRDTRARRHRSAGQRLPAPLADLALDELCQRRDGDLDSAQAGRAGVGGVVLEERVLHPGRAEEPEPAISWLSGLDHLRTDTVGRCRGRIREVSARARVDIK